jgi:hypothetical protein
MTKFFLDTEFIEDGKTIDLISIGIVSEHGDEFYRESCEWDANKASQWVQDNVIPKLEDISTPRRLIAHELRNWVAANNTGRIEFWAYFADYDWVALCQLFGPMIDLPDSFPMYCRDIKQLADTCGKRYTKPPKSDMQHHALVDAKWDRDFYNHLVSL